MMSEERRFGGKVGIGKKQQRSPYVAIGKMALRLFSHLTIHQISPVPRIDLINVLTNMNKKRFQSDSNSFSCQLIQWNSVRINRY